MKKLVQPQVINQDELDLFSNVADINLSSPPPSVSTVYENTSADDKSIGFDFQYYLFLEALIRLKPGETVGYEVKDDIHLEHPNGTLTLIQVKHTLQEKADGSVKNLTSSDPDLWKTLSNWCKIIQDKNDNRDTAKKQCAFIKKTNFILLTNKSFSNTNNFVVLLEQLTSGNISVKELKGYIEDLKTKSGESCCNLHVQQFRMKNSSR